MWAHFLRGFLWHTWILQGVCFWYGMCFLIVLRLINHQALCTILYFIRYLASSSFLMGCLQLLFPLSWSNPQKLLWIHCFCVVVSWQGLSVEVKLLVSLWECFLSSEHGAESKALMAQVGGRILRWGTAEHIQENQDSKNIYRQNSDQRKVKAKLGKQHRVICWLNACAFQVT